jgi:hypothetical protein
MRIKLKSTENVNNTQIFGGFKIQAMGKGLIQLSMKIKRN